MWIPIPDVIGGAGNGIDPAGVARGLHAELLMGKVGDWILEVVAGWGLLLLVSGLYLWWPRAGAGVKGVMVPRRSLKQRRGWRDLHARNRLLGGHRITVFPAERHDLDRFLGRSVCRCLESFPGQHVESGLRIGTAGPVIKPAHQQTVPLALEKYTLPESGAHHTHTTNPDVRPSWPDSLAADC